ncbi:MAG TPA: hypothetical protein PLZ09_06200, partial [Clostridia bacterium]|nr:hypothetical protein [Clostridia bacterium]
NVIFNQGILNIIDSSSSKTGAIKGGHVDDSINENNQGSMGGGIYNEGNFTLSSGNIVENSAFTVGGGVYNNGTFIMNGGKISKNNVYGVPTGSNGGGVSNGKIFILYDGEISENHCIYVGGGVYTSSGNCAFEMYGGKIINNTAEKHGGGMRSDTDAAFIAGGVISGNKSIFGAGMIINNLGINISAGVQIYDNYTLGDDSYENNIEMKNNNALIQITGELTDSGKSTHIGLSSYINMAVTKNYSVHNSGIDPSRYFFADSKNKRIALNEQGEVIVTSGTNTTNKLTWSWNGAGTGGSTNSSSAVVQYKGTDYVISIGGGQFVNENGVSATSFRVKEPGNYAFYVDGDYLNPTFMFTIEGGIITPPSKGNNTITYNGSSFTYDLTNFGFDSEKMFIYNNVETLSGIYYAVVGPKQGYKWSDGTKDLLLYEFIIERKKIDIPKVGNNVLVYSGAEIEYAFNIDENLVAVSDNKATTVGKYTAKVSLKDSGNYCWEDGSTEDKEYPFEIIHPGVVLKDNSNFDY